MKYLIRAFIFFLLIHPIASADYLEVRRSANIKTTPESDAQVLTKPAVGSHLTLLGDGQQTNGYYRVELSSSFGVSLQDGWIYRSLVRRFPGNSPQLDELVPPTHLTLEESLLIESTDIEWPTESNAVPEPHFVFGEPIYGDHDDADNAVLKYSGFTVYWDDEVLAPRWASIKLTNSMSHRDNDMDRLGRFSVDPNLDASQYLITKHKDYNNPPGSRMWSRGHIVQFDNARDWGDKSGRESFYTTNIAPQLQAHNGKRWLALENLCTEFAEDYERVWVYSGPVYGVDPKPFAPNRKVPAPIAFYKIVVSAGSNNSVDVLAFVMPHRDIPKEAPLSDFLTSVDSIEDVTDIDFLHELPDSVEDPIESVVWDLWPDVSN